jgi:hypothetical protein
MGKGEDAMRFIGSTGLVIIAGVVLSAGIGSIDEEAKELGRRLRGRRGSLCEGSIDFTHYNLTVSSGQYERLRARVLASQFDLSVPVIANELSKLIRSSGDVTVGRVRKGSLFYKWGANEDRWRLLRHRVIVESPDAKQRLEQMAEERAVEAVSLESDNEEIGYNGEYTLSVIDGKKAIYENAEARRRFPGVDTLDISLSSLHMMVEEGARPGQTIRTSSTDDQVSVVFSSESSSATYVFSRRLAYAPVHVYAEAKSKRLLEKLYAYSTGTGDAFLPRPCVALESDFRSDGTVEIDLWLVDRWLTTVAESDLQVKLPAEYLLVDRRFGGKPLLVFAGPGRPSNALAQGAEPCDTRFGPEPNAAVHRMSSPSPREGDSLDQIVSQKSQDSPSPNDRPYVLSLAWGAAALLLVSSFTGVVVWLKIRKGATGAD